MSKKITFMTFVNIFMKPNRFCRILYGAMVYWNDVIVNKMTSHFSCVVDINLSENFGSHSISSIEQMLYEFIFYKDLIFS